MNIKDYLLKINNHNISNEQCHSAVCDVILSLYLQYLAILLSLLEIFKSIDTEVRLMIQI